MADEGIFLGYLSTSKTYKVHVAFDETPPQVVGKGTSSFDVAGIDTKDIVEDGDQ
jgi:hypothetical protein